MRRIRFLPALVMFGAVALITLWPSPAQAQWRRGFHSRVFVGGAFYPGPFFQSWYPYPYPFINPYPYAYPVYYDNSGEVRVQVKPRQAQVYVDGYYAGVADDFDGVFQRLHVRPGPHELTLYLKGYHTVRQNVLITPRSDFHLELQLEPLPEGAPPEPPPTPSRTARVPGPPQGPAQRMPPRRGYPPPAPGRTPPSAEPPAAAPAPEPSIDAAQFGTLAIRVQPEDAEVLIDGERWQGPAREGPLSVQLAVGTHHVEIRKDGYQPYSADVQVRPNDTTPLNVSLPASR